MCVSSVGVYIVANVKIVCTKYFIIEKQILTTKNLSLKIEFQSHISWKVNKCDTIADGKNRR